MYFKGMKFYSLTEKMIDRMTFAEFIEVQNMLEPKQEKKVESISTLLNWD